jgi:hypothetical protein
MANTAKIAPVDRKTFTLELAGQFGPVLDALGKPSSNVPFMMPARIASTSAHLLSWAGLTPRLDENVVRHGFSSRSVGCPDQGAATIV